jgi:hypothetical protein
VICTSVIKLGSSTIDGKAVLSDSTAAANNIGSVTPGRRRQVTDRPRPVRPAEQFRMPPGPPGRRRRRQQTHQLPKRASTGQRSRQPAQPVRLRAQQSDSCRERAPHRPPLGPQTPRPAKHSQDRQQLTRARPLENGLQIRSTHGRTHRQRQGYRSAVIRRSSHLIRHNRQRPAHSTASNARRYMTLLWPFGCHARHHA